MTTDALAMDASELRRELDELAARRRRGELRERDYQRQLAERTVELYRAAVAPRLAEGESILAEHHVVRAHMKLNQSLLRESDQQAVSLFATGRRLIRVRSTLRADRPPSCDETDGTIVDELPLAELEGIAVRREIRGGEAIAGLVIIGVALALHSWLLVTGKLMMVLGALGVVHALLLQTRWLELIARANSGPRAEDGAAGRPNPFVILAARRKSARRLVALLRARLREASDAR
jgi:hypothetical protein